MALASLWEIIPHSLSSMATSVVGLEGHPFWKLYTLPISCRCELPRGGRARVNEIAVGIEPSQAFTNQGWHFGSTIPPQLSRLLVNSWWFLFFHFYHMSSAHLPKFLTSHILLNVYCWNTWITGFQWVIIPFTSLQYLCLVGYHPPPSDKAGFLSRARVQNVSFSAI